jgi:hypothetical protein
MLVVLVMDVAVLMLHRFVPVVMLVPLDEVQVQPDAHERGRREKPPGHRLAKRQDRDCGTGEGGEREIRAGSGRPEVAQGQDEQGKRDPVSQEADDRRPEERTGRW